MIAQYIESTFKLFKNFTWIPLNLTLSLCEKGNNHTWW